MGDIEITHVAGWPPVAQEFAARFASAEASLKASRHLKPKKIAEANWIALADVLGEKFLEHIRQTGEAGTLLNEPPRRRMANSFNFEPEHPDPIQNVRELFSRGVCQVRNNLLHGEKYSVSGNGWDRDDLLVNQALFVLKKAITEAAAVGFIK